MMGSRVRLDFRLGKGLSTVPQHVSSIKWHPDSFCEATVTMTGSTNAFHNCALPSAPLTAPKIQHRNTTTHNLLQTTFRKGLHSTSSVKMQQKILTLWNIAFINKMVPAVVYTQLYSIIREKLLIRLFIGRLMSICHTANPKMFQISVFKPNG